MVLGKEYNRLPGEIGVLVSNTTTAITFAESVKTGLPMYKRFVTLSGDGFKNPQNINVRIGTMLSEVVAATGGYIDGVPTEFTRLIVGGSFMGNSFVTDEVAIFPICNAFLCLSGEGMLDVRPCMRCGRCIACCPSGLQPEQIAKATKEKDFDLLKILGVRKCMGCGSCTYVCPSHIDIADAVKKAKVSYIKLGGDDEDEI